MRANGRGIASQWQVKALTEAAHPADLARRHARHERIGLHAPVDHSARSDECVFAYHRAADNGAIGAQGGPSAHQSVAVLAFAADGRAGIVDVGKNHTGAAKHVVFDFDPIVYRDVVLDFDVVADHDAISDKYVLAKRTASANVRARAYMHPVPDPAAITNMRARVYDGAWVDD